MKRSVTEVPSSEYAVKKTKTDDEAHPTILLLGDSAPHLGNLLRKTMSTHEVCQIMVTCSPREQLNLGAATLYNKSKLQFSPNLRRVAWKNSNRAIVRIEILNFESGKVSKILLTHFFDDEGSDMEDDDAYMCLCGFCLSDDALFVWIEASSLGDDVIRMVRMDLESQSIDWMEDGDLNMLGYYAPLDQIITCQKRDEKVFMVRVNAKTGEKIGQPFDMTPYYNDSPKFLINVHQDMVLLWEERQLIFSKQNLMAYQVLKNELDLNEIVLYIDKDLIITSDRLHCYDNHTGIDIGTVDCLRTGLPKYTKYCWLSSRGDTIIVWEWNQLFATKFHVEKKMIECPLGSAARSEVLRLNGKLPKTFILNEFTQPLNAYVRAIVWNDKQWMVLNDERMGVLDPFLIIISTQYKDGKTSVVGDKTIYLKDAMIHVNRRHAKFEIPFMEFLSKLQRVEPQVFKFKDDPISAFVDYPKIVRLLGDDLPSAEIDQCYKKFVKSQQEGQTRKKKVLELVIKLQDQTVKVNGTDYSRADLVVAYEVKIGREKGCITFIKKHATSK